MNTGVPDAWDLGWKLAAAEAVSRLFGRYDIERQLPTRRHWSRPHASRRTAAASVDRVEADHQPVATQRLQVHGFLHTGDERLDVRPPAPTDGLFFTVEHSLQSRAAVRPARYSV